VRRKRVGSDREPRTKNSNPRKPLLLEPSASCLERSSHASMKLFAIVPVKDLEESKTRLSPFLSPKEREVLTLWMLDHVLTTLRETPDVERVGVVTPSPRALFLAEDVDATALPQASRGLNNALEEGRNWAVSEDASSLLVLPADLPYLSTFDVRALTGLARDERTVVISPDEAHEGTNALLMRPANAMPFAFGPGSYESHMRTARENALKVEVYEHSGVASDVDTVEDLQALVDSGLLP
jgi:2-phospho-L-lactate/phosphoenolpyruvate guanylyltransferase